MLTRVCLALSLVAIPVLNEDAAIAESGPYSTPSLLPLRDLAAATDSQPTTVVGDASRGPAYISTSTSADDGQASPSDSAATVDGAANAESVVAPAADAGHHGGTSACLDGSCSTNNCCNPWANYRCPSNGCEIGGWFGGPSLISLFGRPHGRGGHCHGHCGTCTVGCCDTGGCCVQSGWYGGLYGLVMTRDRSDNVILVEDVNPSVPVSALTSRDASMDWGGGAEVRIGYRFCCSCWGLEGVYWGLWPDDEEANVLEADFAPSGLAPALNFSGLDIGGNNVGTIASNALNTRLRRTYEYQNIELNLVRFSGGNQCHCGWAWNWSAGVRFFRLDENWQLGFDEGDTAFTLDNAAEVFYDIDVENNLVGGQIGGRAEYWIRPCWSLFGDLKFGLYGNHIRHESRIHDAFQDAVALTSGDDLNVRSSKNDVAFLGEVRLGMGYEVCCGWRLVGGYRAVALTGVAVPSGQIPRNLENLAEIEAINSSSSVILHGAFAGVECSF